MSNPEELRTNFGTSNIKKHVELIRNLINKMILENKTDPFEYESEIMTQYPDFYQDYPSLVKTLCKKDDISILMKMLDSLDMVQNGNKSLAGVELKLGEELANKYLYPNMKKSNK
jgi:hypothetical protein